MGKYTRPSLPIDFIMGQSNADGRAKLTGATGTYPMNNTNVNIFYKTNFDTNDNGTWQTLQVGVNNTNPNQIANAVYAHEVSLGQLFFQNTGKKLWIIKCALGSTSANFDWNPSLTGNLAEYAINSYFKPAIQKMISQGKPVVIGIIIHQGEQDSDNVTDANSMYSGGTGNFKNWMDYIRSAHPLLNNSIIHVTELTTQTGAAGYPQFALVNTALNNYCNDYSYTRWIQTRDISNPNYSDKIHCTPATQETIGLRHWTSINLRLSDYSL